MRFAFITRNLSLKVFSLVASVLVFLFVSVENATPLDVEFRIEYLTADDMMVTGDAPTVLRATLEGPWASLRNYKTTDLKPVVIDLAKLEPGTVRHQIATDDIEAPAGMRIVTLHPAEVEVTLDRRVERQVAVEPDIIERPAFGYEIVAVRIEPPQVRVAGPLARMRTLDFVTTRPIDVGGREDDVSIEVDLRPPPSGLRLVDRKVKVLVEIGEEQVQRTFQGVRVVLENAPKGSKSVPETVTVTLKGPRRTVDSMDAKTLQVFVDALPEVTDEALQRFEKAVGLKAVPETTVLVNPVPKVVVQVGKPTKTRRT